MTVNKINRILETWNIELVSFGLAPNPNGFCFEVLGGRNGNIKHILSNKEIIQRRNDIICLDKMLGSLSKDEEKKLKRLWL